MRPFWASFLAPKPPPPTRKTKEGGTVPPFPPGADWLRQYRAILGGEGEIKGNLRLESPKKPPRSHARQDIEEEV